MTLLTLQRARYVLAQQGEWIFDGLLQGEVLEYVVTLCTLFRLMAAPKQNPANLANMTALCDRFQFLHTRLMPPPCRPLQFHRLQHGVESVKDFGPMFIYWCFRAERTMGRLVKMVRRRNGVEAHLSAVLRRELMGRQMCGMPAAAESCLQEIATTFGHAGPLVARKSDQDLWKFAYRIIQRRERLGYRLDLAKFPEGSPLTGSSWQKLPRTEFDFFRSSL